MRWIVKKIRNAVIRCLDQNKGDETLVAELEKIIAKEGPEACQVIFQVLANLDLEQDEATMCWHETLDHQNAMTSLLGRRVSLTTALCDYFCSIHKSLKNPKVVEIHVYEKTVMDSNYDGLTGLMNRRYFDNALNREMSQAKRYNTDLSLLFLDLDDFKYFNDTYGHQAGDRALKMVADVIMKAKRTGDIATRYGGEEMVVIMPQTGNIEALVLGERIRERLENIEMECGGKSVNITVSGGVASYPANAEDATSLVKLADSALYRAKGSGKNAISLFSQDKRRFLRFDFTGAIQVRKLGFKETITFTGESKDISLGGVLFEHDSPLDIGARIQISIPLRNEAPLLIIGTVVRMEALDSGRYDVGVSISFQELDKITKHEIKRYLASQLKSSS